VVRRRTVLSVLGVTALGAVCPAVARATTARAVRLEELVRQSRRVAMVTPLDAYSVWETVGDQRRIVTYTRVRFDDHVQGEAPSDPELLVRTLGGRVNGVGQIVHGEAQLLAGERSLVFLRSRADGSSAITAMAQGHYPVQADRGGVLRLSASPGLPELLQADGGAVARLRGASVADAVQRIREASKK
jgi:hypothetical protein